MIYNYLYRTYPAIVHSPTGNVKIWNDILTLLFKESRKFHINDLTILTWNSLDEESILEKALNNFGIPHIVLGKGINPWFNCCKIDLTCQELDKVYTKYVMGLDAFDAVITADPMTAVTKFEDMSCDILFNAGVLNHPYDEELGKFEEDVGSTYFFKHLNAGAWIGESQFARDFFSIAKLFYEKDIDKKDSEQYYVRHAFRKFYPKSMIDYDFKIFQTICPTPIPFVLDCKLHL